LYDIVRRRPRPHGKEDAASRQSVQFVESVNRIIEENIANADSPSTISRVRLR